MRKMTTLYFHPIRSGKDKKNELLEFLPKEESIEKILKFAACYRTTPTNDNHFLDYHLN